MVTTISIAKILLPVEFSERCLGAARCAEFLANHFHAELALLHVVTAPYVAYGEINAYPPAADFYAGRWEQKRRELEAFLRDAPSGVRVERVLMDGEPARQIVDYAHRGGFDLVVMPTHGYGAVRRFLAGSVTARVLREAKCAVWAGPHLEQAPPWEDFAVRRIVCALDLGPESGTVLEWANAIAREFSAELVTLHVLPTSTMAAGGFRFHPDWRLQAEREARRKIAQLQADTGADREVRMVSGEVAPAVRDFARLRRADLLVIGRTQRSGVLSRLQASEFSILREAPCPVVSI
jgi:nucleotide-binding universal stress UspA family protein